MKNRLLSLFVAAGLFMAFSCKQDPQKHAEAEAQKEQREADKHADQVDEHMESTADHANQALEHQTREQLNSAIAGVPVPKLTEGTGANDLVKDIGNHAVEFINSENYQQAGKFIDQMQSDLAKLQKKESNGSISAEDAQQIKDYANALANSIGVTLE